MALTVANLRDAIMRELGHPEIQVELSEKQLDRCIQRALNIFNRYQFGFRRYAIGSSASQKKYELDLSKMPGFIDVYHTSFVRPDMTGGVSFTDNPLILERRVLGVAAVDDLSFGPYAMALGALKDSQKVFSSDPEWEGHWETKQDPAFPLDPTKRVRAFYLYIDLPDKIVFPYAVSIVYGFAYTLSDDPLLGLPCIPPTKEQWFTDYALAFAKGILGRIRDKFKGIPGASDGDEFQLDGGDLRNESNEELAKLEDDIKQMKRQIPITLD